MPRPSGNKPFILAVMGFFAGVSSFYKGFLLLKKKRLIENTPTSKIRSIAMGLVEVYGKVVPYNENLLMSQFSKKKCVYYRYIVEELRGGKSKNWETIQKSEEAVPFYLQDDTGSVLVDA